MIFQQESPQMVLQFFENYNFTQISYIIFTDRQRSFGKVTFLQVSVILFGGGQSVSGAFLVPGLMSFSWDVGYRGGRVSGTQGISGWDICGVGYVRVFFRRGVGGYLGRRVSEGFMPYPKPDTLWRPLRQSVIILLECFLVYTNVRTTVQFLSPVIFLSKNI